MKTRFKTSSKTQKKSILENSNFLNSQNYMKDSRSKLYFTYYKDYNFIEFLLYLFLSMLFIGLSMIIIFIILEAFEEINIIFFFIISTPGLLGPLFLATFIMRKKKYKRLSKNIIITYNKPYYHIKEIIVNSNSIDNRYNYTNFFNIKKVS